MCIKFHENWYFHSISINPKVELRSVIIMNSHFGTISVKTVLFYTKYVLFLSVFAFVAAGSMYAGPYWKLIFKTKSYIIYYDPSFTSLVFINIITVFAAIIQLEIR